jgi:CRISPR-associated protein Csd1
MILTELYNLYGRQQREGDPMPSMYGKVKIRWLIPINADGSLRGQFIDLKGATKAEQRGKQYVMPDLVRAAGIKPKLLADNGEYVLGLQKEGADAKKVMERYRQFKELLQRCADITQELSIKATLGFYEQWNPEGFEQEGIDPADNFTFEVHGLGDRKIIPASAAESLTAVQDFWAIETADKDSPIMTCLVTGKLGPVEARLPVKIKGVPNGQTAGTSLVSANAAPFSSYGLENSLTSPISRDAGEGFGKALNELISGSKTRIYLGPVVYTFWARGDFAVEVVYEALDEDQSEEFRRESLNGDLNGEDQPGEAKALFGSAQSGMPQYGVEVDRFYALGLSASGGRAVVRSWIDIPVAEAQANLDAWFDAQQIVDKYGQIADLPYFSVKSLARSMYRKGEDFEMQCSSLIDVALKGGRLPGEMLAMAVRRTAIEHDLPHHRAALIKLVLTKNSVIHPHTPMNELNLDPTFDDEKNTMAYHCGRLLSHLESIQRAAMGDINTTLIDRYYGAASGTPGKVFGELVKDAQAHLRKLRVTKPGTHEALQQKLEGIMVKFYSAECFPHILTMQQQSIFALGYYHQRAANRKEALDRKAENEAKKAAEKVSA